MHELTVHTYRQVLEETSWLNGGTQESRAVTDALSLPTGTVCC